MVLCYKANPIMVANKLVQCAVLLATVLVLTSCSGDRNKNEQSISDTIIIRDTIYNINLNRWQEGFGLTHDPDKDSIWNKPVRFYIKNKQCSPIAMDFYYGSFKPSDNYLTEELLSLASSSDESLRPFYRWCLNKTIQIQDGALAEYTGKPARQYAEKFPKEFFEYMDNDSTGNKYLEWSNAIMYSGYYENDSNRTPNEIRNNFIDTMKANCLNCNHRMRKRIEKFVADCFPNTTTQSP